MKKSIITICVFSLLAGGFSGTSAYLRAQDTKNLGAEAKESARRPGVIPFHGKLKGVDNEAKTISVHDLTIQVTAETKIDKAGNPAGLEDGVVGEIVSGGYRKSENGNLIATKVHFGPKEPKAHSKRNANENESQ